ncbi:MAG TPA: YncE family protein [Acidobacteriota bacterium]
MTKSILLVLLAVLIGPAVYAQATHKLYTTIRLDSVPVACSLSSDNQKLAITTADEQVLVYDLRLARVVRRIRVEGSPLYIHRLPHGKLAVVGFWNGRRIGLFDLYGNRLMRNVPTGDGPTFFAQYNQTILLAQSREQRVSFLNGFNLRSAKDLSFDGAVGGLAVAPRRRTAYVIVGMHKIAVIDLLSRSVLHSFEVLTARDSPLKIDRDERWLFALGPRNTLLRISLDVERETKRISTGSGPVGLAISADGKYLYVCNGLEGSVAVFETDTLTEQEQIQVGVRPAFVEPGSDNRYVLVCNRGSKTIAILERVSAGSKIF